MTDSSAIDRQSKGDDAIIMDEARRLLGCFTEAQVRELGQCLNIPRWQIDGIVAAVFTPAVPSDPETR